MIFSKLLMHYTHRLKTFLMQYGHGSQFEEIFKYKSQVYEVVTNIEDSRLVTMKNI